jgi:lysyl-tRNA synthetase class 2
MVVAIDAIRFHRFGLAGREPLLLMLGASLLTFAATRLYTRLARMHNWRSGRVGGVHLHHLVVGNVLVLICGMFQLAFQPGDIGVDILSVGFGVGAAFVLDEFALSVHMRDVYWTPEGRHSIEVSVMWALLGLLLLTGISPFGIHDQTEIPRIVGFSVIVINIVLSVITCLKGKLTLGLLSIFLPPVGVVAATRLARPGSVWAQLFYGPAKLEAARRRYDPATSSLEALRHRLTDLVGGSHQGEAAGSE